MADCVMINSCPFFNDRMKNMPALSNIYKKKYCHGDFQKCARFLVRKAG